MVGGEGVVIGGVFAGDDGRGGVDVVFQALKREADLPSTENPAPPACYIVVGPEACHQGMFGSG